MATGDFDLYYPDHPWSGITTKERAYYVADLLQTFRARSIFRPFVRHMVDLEAQKTGTMYVDEVFDTEPDTTAIPNRDIWLVSRHLDSRRLTLTMEKHGDKIALLEYDRLVTFWKQNGGDLSAICRGALGQNMTDYLDLLARNAIIGAPYKIYCGSASDFSGLSSSTVYDPQTGQKVWKSMANMHIPMAQNPVTSGLGTLLAVTSPVSIYDIQNQASTTLWVDVLKYSRPEMALSYEVGAWAGVRYLQTPRCTLHNTGTQTLQTLLAAAITEGDGAPATAVDSVYTVGQPSGVTNHIQLTSAAGLSVGDIITVHKTRTNAYGVTNGVDPTEGTARHRRIVKISGNNVSVEKPLLDAFTTSHYVTMGEDVEMTVFFGGPEALAAGFAQPPRVLAPPPIDDFEEVYRFVWKMYSKYQLFRVEFLAIAFCGGSSFFEYSFPASA
jgi:N4-gp56 family major capsid protein